MMLFSLFVSGYLLFKDFCENVSEEPVPQLRFYEEVNFLERSLLIGRHKKSQKTEYSRMGKVVH